MAVDASHVGLTPLDAIPWVRYAVTTRDPHAPLGGDMSFTTGADDSSGVLANRARALASIGHTPETAVMSGLVHGTTVRRVTKQERGRGVPAPGTAIAHTDGLIADEVGVALMMCFADCVPLIVIDCERHCIGLAHAGWRGTLAGMAGSVVAAMVTECASDPSDLVAVIGPSIGPEAYAVGADLADRFVQEYSDDPIITRACAETHLNLWESNRRQLLRAGLRAEAVHTSGLCTFANGKRFFSHRYARAHAEREGRFAVLLAIEE